MVSQLWYAVLIVLVALERLAELVVARRNLTWSRVRGGHEVAPRHYPLMVALHSGLLVSCLTEVLVGGRPFYPWLGWPMLALVGASQGLRWWCVRALGHQWNTRIVVTPGLTRVTGGPYRYLTHPNYVAVVVEGVALSMVHTAWISGIVFTAANGVLLRVRIRAENRALADAYA